MSRCNHWPENTVDKKAKKKINLLNQRLTKLRQQLAGTIKQPDEPDDVQRIKREIADVEAQLQQLKDSK